MGCMAPKNTASHASPKAPVQAKPTQTESSTLDSYKEDVRPQRLSNTNLFKPSCRPGWDIIIKKEGSYARHSLLDISEFYAFDSDVILGAGREGDVKRGKNPEKFWK